MARFELKELGGDRIRLGVEQPGHLAVKTGPPAGRDLGRDVLLKRVVREDVPAVVFFSEEPVER